MISNNLFPPCSSLLPTWAEIRHRYLSMIFNVTVIGQLCHSQCHFFSLEHSSTPTLPTKTLFGLQASITYSFALKSKKILAVQICWQKSSHSLILYLFFALTILCWDTTTFLKIVCCTSKNYLLGMLMIAH